MSDVVKQFSYDCGGRTKIHTSWRPKKACLMNNLFQIILKSRHTRSDMYVVNNNFLLLCCISKYFFVTKEYYVVQLLLLYIRMKINYKK